MNETRFEIQKSDCNTQNYFGRIFWSADKKNRKLFSRGFRDDFNHILLLYYNDL